MVLETLVELGVEEEELPLVELAEEDGVVDAAEETEPLVEEATEVTELPRVEGFPVPPVISN